MEKWEAFFSRILISGSNNGGTFLEDNLAKPIKVLKNLQSLYTSKTTSKNSPRKKIISKIHKYLCRGMIITALCIIVKK